MKLLGALASVVSPAFGWISGAREWLTLLAVAGAAAYLWVQFSTIRNDRDQLASFAAVICASAGEAFAASDPTVTLPDGKTARRHAARGDLCKARVAELALHERQTAEASARILAQAMQDHERKTGTDAEAARRAAIAARRAADNMEKADAAITQDDRVGAAWFGAVNDVGGLRRQDR